MGRKGWAYRLRRVWNDEQLRAAAHFAKHARADALAAHSLRREVSASGQSDMCLTYTLACDDPGGTTRASDTQYVSPSTRCLPSPFCTSLSLPLAQTLARSRALSLAGRHALGHAVSLPGPCCLRAAATRLPVLSSKCERDVETSTVVARCSNEA